MNKPLQKSNFNFLIELSKNNNKQWFSSQQARYEKELETIRSFSDGLISEMNKHDNIETPNAQKSLFRIYRDVRFSKDKSPYKSYWGGHLRRATRWLRGGYYYHLEPGNSYVAGGFFGPNKEDLFHIRQQIANDPDAFRQVLNAPLFKNTFGVLEGKQLKTAPRDFPKDHEALDLLRYKSFVARKNFTDAEVMHPDFLKNVVHVYKNLRPFFDYMSEILTTDLNGELLEK